MNKTTSQSTNKQKSLIIFTHGGGRMANQMTNMAHMIALLEEYWDDFEMINMAFWSYTELFEHFVTNPLCLLPANHRPFWMPDFLKKLMQKQESAHNNYIFTQYLRFIHLLSFLPERQSIIKNRKSVKKFIIGIDIKDFSFNNTENINLLKSKPVTYLAGWAIRSWVLFEKHQQKIRETLQIRNDFLTIAKQFVEPLRKEYGMVIGVQIRQTDYRTFYNGKYYFESSKYALWMTQVGKLLNRNDIMFIIASDEKQNASIFHGLNFRFATGNPLGNGHYMESFAELTHCDMLMTPPSTYTVWAAFLADIPIIALYDKEQVIGEEHILRRHLFDALTHPEFSFAVK